MFTLVKSSTTSITFSIPQDLRYHQFTIKPDGSATAGNFIFHTLVDNAYVQLQGVDVSLDLLRPVTIEGIFKGFMIDTSDYDGSSFTIEYIGE